nr:hypothetical protein [Chlamydiota bacterium]
MQKIDPIRTIKSDVESPKSPACDIEHLRTEKAPVTYKNPFYALRQILFELGLTDKDGLPVKELAELQLLHLNKKEKRQLYTILKKEISHHDFAKGIHFSTSLKDLEYDLDHDLVLRALYANGSAGLKKIIRSYLPRLLCHAYHHIHHQKLILDTPILDALKNFCEIFCVETDTDIQNYYSYETLNAVYRANDYVIAHLKKNSKRPSYLGKSWTSVKLDSKESGVFNKLHKPGRDDKNRLVLHSFKKSKIEIAHIERIARPSILTRETIRFNILPLLRGDWKSEIIPECHLANPWIAFFDIIQGYISHFQKHSPKHKDFPYEGNDIFRTWYNYVKGHSAREVDHIHDLVEALLKECRAKKPENVEKILSERLISTFEDHLPSSPNSAAALMWKVLTTLHNHEGINDAFLVKLISLTCPIWTGAKIDYLLEFILSGIPKPIDSAFALFNIISWLGLHSGAKNIELIPSDEDKTSLDFQIRLNQEKRAFISQKLTPKESFDFLVQNPLVIKKAFKFIPKLSQFNLSPFIDRGLFPIDTTEYLKHKDPYIRRLALLMFLTNKKLEENSSIYESAFFQNLLSYKLSIDQLRLLETYFEEEDFFHFLIDAKEKELSLEFAICKTLRHKPEFHHIVIQLMKEVADKVPNQVDDYLRLFQELHTHGSWTPELLPCLQTVLKSANPSELTHDHYVILTSLLNHLISLEQWDQSFPLYKLILEKFDTSHEKASLSLELCQQLKEQEEPILSHYIWTIAQEHGVWELLQKDESYLDFICKLQLLLIQNNLFDCACAFFHNCVSESTLPIRTKSMVLIQIINLPDDFNSNVEHFLKFFNTCEEQNALINLVINRLPTEKCVILLKAACEQPPASEIVNLIANYIQQLITKSHFNLAKEIWLSAFSNNLWKSLKNRRLKLIASLFKHFYQQDPQDVAFLSTLMKKLKPALQMKKTPPELKKLLIEIGNLQTDYLNTHPEETDQENVAPLHLFCLSRRQVLPYQIRFLESLIKKGHIEEAFELLKKLKGLQSKEASHLLNLVENSIRKSPIKFVKWVYSPLMRSLYRMAEKSSYKFQFEMLTLQTIHNIPEKETLFGHILLHVKTDPSLISDELIDRVFMTLDQTTSPSSKLLNQISQALPDLVKYLESNDLKEIGFNLLDGYFINRPDGQLPKELINFALECCYLRSTTFHIQAETLLKSLMRKDKCANNAIAIQIMEKLAEQYSATNLSRSHYWLMQSITNNKLMTDNNFTLMKTLTYNLIIFQHPIAHDVVKDYLRRCKKSSVQQSLLDSLVSAYHPLRSRKLSVDLNFFHALSTILKVDDDQPFFDVVFELLHEIAFQHEKLSKSDGKKYSHLFIKCIDRLDPKGDTGHTFYYFLNSLSKGSYKEHLWALSQFAGLSKGLCPEKKLSAYFNLIDHSMKHWFNNQKLEIPLSHILPSYGEMEEYIDIHIDNTKAILIRIRIIPALLSLKGDREAFLKSVDYIKHSLSYRADRDQKQLVETSDTSFATKLFLSWNKEELKELKQIEQLSFRTLGGCLLPSNFLDPDAEDAEKILIEISRSCSKYYLSLKMAIEIAKRLSPYTSPAAFRERVDMIQEILKQQKLNKMSLVPKEIAELVIDVFQVGIETSETPLRSYLDLSQYQNLFYFLINDPKIFYLYLYQLIYTRENTYLSNAEYFINKLFPDKKKRIGAEEELTCTINLARAVTAKDSSLLHPALIKYIELLSGNIIDSHNTVIHDLAVPILTENLFNAFEYEAYSIFIKTIYVAPTIYYKYFSKRLPWILNDFVKHIKN